MPDNEDRADWAGSALHTHSTLTGTRGKEDADTQLGDLLANLHHFAAREGLDFKKLVDRGTAHYYEESGLGYKCPQCKALRGHLCLVRRRGKRAKPRHKTHKAREKLTEGYGW